MADTANKTEKPTPRRIQKARREGRFPDTRHLLSGFQFFAVVLLLSWGFEHWLQAFQRLCAHLIQRAAAHPLTPGEFLFLSRETLVRSLLPVAMAGGSLVVFGILVQLLATQFGFSFKNLAPNFHRLNIAARIPGVIRENLNQTVQALILLPVFFYLTYTVCRDNAALLLRLPLSRLPEELRAVSGLFHSLLWKAAFALLLFGVFAHLRERRRYTRGLMMSRQEIIEEHKEIEGNMLVRMRIRRLQRDLRRANMLRKVPLATAVVVNPTHYAVALRYEMDSQTAPVVVAKGKNYIALRIRAVAESHHVPVVENPPLAQALYRSVEVGQEIPPEFYRAVAEILAYVYQVLMARHR